VITAEFSYSNFAQTGFRGTPGCRNVLSVVPRDENDYLRNSFIIGPKFVCTN